VIDPERFRSESEAFREKMLATMIMPNKMVAYEGRIDGVECIVVGYSKHADPRRELVPLAIVITPEVFDVLEIDGTKVDLSGGIHSFRLTWVCVDCHRGWWLPGKALASLDLSHCPACDKPGELVGITDVYQLRNGGTDESAMR
jgi:hypothetical protein